MKKDSFSVARVGFAAKELLRFCYVSSGKVTELLVIRYEVTLIYLKHKDFT